MRRNNMPNTKQENNANAKTYFKNHAYKHIKSNTGTTFPWFGKTYNNLNSTLTHLKMQTRQTTWPIGTCPINNEHIKPEQNGQQY